MSLRVAEVYDAFKAVGASDTVADAAARAILVERDQLVTRDYLDARLNGLESTFLKWAVGLTVAGAGLVIGAITLIMRVMAP